MYEHADQLMLTHADSRSVKALAGNWCRGSNRALHQPSLGSGQCQIEDTCRATHPIRPCPAHICGVTLSFSWAPLRSTHTRTSFPSCTAQHSITMPLFMGLQPLTDRLTILAMSLILAGYTCSTPHPIRHHHHRGSNWCHLSVKCTQHYRFRYHIPKGKHDVTHLQLCQTGRGPLCHLEDIPDGCQRSRHWHSTGLHSCTVTFLYYVGKSTDILKKKSPPPDGVCRADSGVFRVFRVYGTKTGRMLGSGCAALVKAAPVLHSARHMDVRPPRYMHV